MRSKTVDDPFKMLPAERRAAAWLASIYALRMFGMFMILPVFAMHAPLLEGGSNISLVGLAMGIYGLTQACLQIPLGWASDKLGRKPIIIAGLVVFTLGCALGFVATSIETMIVARALQGLGAISAALSAYLADSTRDEVRSKGMAMIGAAIGSTFALSLVLSPVLYRFWGLEGLFALTGILSVCAIFAVLCFLPKTTSIQHLNYEVNTSAMKELLKPDLLRLNLGIFVLHLTQMALFVVVPGLLATGLGLDVTQHWKVYLPVLLISFLVMLPIMIWGERQAKTRGVKLAAIVTLGLVMCGFWGLFDHGWAVVVLLGLFFVSFNLLEATLPSWVSRVAPLAYRGLALGVYNTSQALGLFTGGVLGGVVLGELGTAAVFQIILLAVVCWLCAAFGIQALPRRVKKSNANSADTTVKV